ncbi:MAG: chorismate-binding protein, partial [Porphyromonadaceae bacterium]|nr:chorismate-binding protein [Porphyromonadaceae bacterium]
MHTPFQPSEQVWATLEAMNEASHRGQPFFFILDFELQEGVFVLEPLQHHDGSLFFDFPTAKTPDPIGSKGMLTLTPSPEAPERYAERFDIIHRGLMRGDSFLTNLTIRTPIETEASLADIYLSSEATYRVLLPGRFVSFSPECFVKLQGDELATHPMKGTIDARIPSAAERLRADYKEGCEHHTI